MQIRLGALKQTINNKKSQGYVYRQRKHKDTKIKRDPQTHWLNHHWVMGFLITGIAIYIISPITQQVRIALN